MVKVDWKQPWFMVKVDQEGLWYVENNTGQNNAHKKLQGALDLLS